MDKGPRLEVFDGLLPLVLKYAKNFLLTRLSQIDRKYSFEHVVDGEVALHLA